MVFNKNIPLATDLISNSQADLFNNNQFLGDSTGNAVIVTGDPVGYYRLPNGLLIQWGAKTNQSAAPTRTVTFAIAFSAPPYSIQATPQRDTADPGATFEFYVDATTVATTGFDILNRSGHAYAWYWFAIGPA